MSNMGGYREEKPTLLSIANSIEDDAIRAHWDRIARELWGTKHEEIFGSVRDVDA